MAKNFRQLETKMGPERRAKVAARVEALLRDMPLDELREARAMTQEHLAKILNVNQSAISKMERRADMYVSTLQDFVKAMGGQLEIRAVFPDGTVRISQFSELAKAR
jgi:ribosome-binding protein aMBF1 (putative translation factor)